MFINRHLSRSIALQILFELDTNQNLSANEEEIKKIIKRQINEFAIAQNDLDSELNINDNNYILNLIKSVQDKILILDEIIERAAPEWPIEKINIIDRNILRIGLIELLFGEDLNVPPKVAIDEAIELAKNYGGETSYKFVNGVLGTIYKEMGEPRKEEKSLEDNQKKNKNLETQSLVGALIYSIIDGKIFFAFVKDIFKYWTLSKGKLLEGEDVRVGCIRKIKEEIGINIVIKDLIEENSYIANNNDGKKIRKNVIYFLAEANYEPFKLDKENKGILEASWIAIDEIENLKIYNDIKNIIKLGIEKMINQKYED